MKVRIVEDRREWTPDWAKSEGQNNQRLPPLAPPEKKKEESCG